MRALLAAALLATLALAGCTGPATDPNLRPPCQDSAPVRIEIQTDKERYFPGEIMNVTLLLNSTGRAATLQYRSWELGLKTFDGRAVRTYVKDLGGGDETATKNVPANGRVGLQERFQVFRVTEELWEPLPPGTYYLCAVLTGVDGSDLAHGARPFIAERAPERP